jgi:hypothetical protein
MALTTYKPLLAYGLALTLLGITASAFQSATLTHVAVAAYIIGWALFLWNLLRTKSL